MLYTTSYITPCYEGVLRIITKVLFNTLLYNRCDEAWGVLYYDNILSMFYNIVCYINNVINQGAI